MKPTKSDVFVDKIATAFSLAYKNQNYIATDVFPIVRVKQSSGKYFIFTKGWLRDEAKLRAPGGEYPEGDYELSTGTYSTKQFAFSKSVPDEIRENADEPLAPDRNASEFITEKLLLKVERTFVSDCFKTGVWGTDITLSGTSQWSDYANSDPLGVIETGIFTVAKASGRKPNTLALGMAVWQKLKHHPDIIEKYKYTQPGNITPELVAAVFELDRVLVGSAIYDTAVEGAPPSTDWVWGKHALLLYVPASPALEEQSAGYTLQFSDRVIKRFRDEPRDRDVFKGKWELDMVKTDASCGYFIANAVA